MFVGVAVLLAALAVSFSRSPVAGLLAALLALIVLEWRRVQVWRLLAFVVAVMAGLAILAAYWIPNLAEAYWLRLSDTIVYAGGETAAVLSGRLETWALLLDRLAAHPGVLLTGIGYKTLPYTSYFGEPVTADNMYLSLIAETGIPGLLLMGVLTIAMLRAGLEARRSGSRAAWFYGTWFVCFWVSELVQMLSVDVLTYWRVLPLAFFTLALARREAMAGEAAAVR
jgi:O-antigen ligase